MSSKREQALGVFGEWYASVQKRAKRDFPKGTMAGCLVVLDHLKSDYDLDLNTHLTKNKGQVRGAGGGALRKILTAFGENRGFASEGGRTNRGLLGDIEGMLAALRPLELDAVPAAERQEVLTALQGFVVERVRDFHRRQRLRIAYDPSKSTWQNVHDILEEAREHGSDGPVAQYLVGAKLQLRFPDLTIGNESYSTADQQLGRAGDFLVGDTAFHVTVSPQDGLFVKCRRNLDDGLRVYVLVPERRLAAARQMADLAAEARIAVECIESFVGQNVEELSQFTESAVRSEFLNLLSLYNQRVDGTEMDKSMLIELPRNLAR